MSGIYDIALANGASNNFSVLGDYVKVVSAPAGAVQIKLDGGESFLISQGQGVRIGKQFRDVGLVNKSGSAQLIMLFIGDARFEDTSITGTVRVVDEITDNVAVATLAPGTAVTAFLASQIIAPAANVRGLIVRGYQLTIESAAGGSVSAAIVACKSLPIGYSSPAQMFRFSGGNTSGAQRSDTQDSRINKLLPPGWGLYLLDTVLVNPAVQVSVLVNTELL